MEKISFASYFEALRAHLTSRLDWLSEVVAYAELDFCHEPPEPIAAVSLIGVNPKEQHPSGQNKTVLQMEVLLIVGNRSAHSAIAATDAALSIYLELQNSKLGKDTQWGNSIGWAQVYDVVEDGFMSELDGFHTWSLKFSQELLLGPTFISADPARQGVNVATNPGDPADENEYERVSNA